MRAVSDQDHAPARTVGRAGSDADTAVVWDAHIGGIPLCLIGFESRPVAREGLVPADGPSVWTVGHPVPAVLEEGRPSHQRGQRQPTGRRARQPLRLRRLTRVDADDGSSSTARRSDGRSPTSTGRSCSSSSPATTAARSSCSPSSSTRTSRSSAVEGSYASVIGGAPAAAVVFAREVDARTQGRPEAGRGGRARRVEAASRRNSRRLASSTRSPRRCDRRSWARSPRSSTASTASSVRSRSARSIASSRRRACGRISVDALERGIARVTASDSHEWDGAAAVRRGGSSIVRRRQSSRRRRRR